MKKFYILALSFALLSSASIAQKVQQISRDNAAPQIQRVESIVQMPSAQKDSKDIITLWQNDFSDFTQWQVGNMPNGLQGEFEWTPNVDGLPSTLVANEQGLSYFHGQLFDSPTVTNGFVYCDGIQYLLAGTVQDQNFYIQWNGTAIDLTGTQGAFLRFYQRYRAFNYDETFVEVSVDGGSNWTSYQVNQEVEVNTYAPMGYKVVNITSAITGAADLSNVKVRFRWQAVGASAPQYGSGYAWLIDDVEIYEAFNNEMVFERAYGSMYHNIPLAQVQPVTFKGAVHNFGINTQNNVVVSVKKGTETLATSTPKNLAAGVRDTITAGSYTFPSIGAYQLNYSVTQDEEDQQPANNSRTINVNVTSNIYARDNGVYQTGWQISEYNQEIKCVVMYEVPVEKELTHVRVALASTTLPGVEIQGILYEYDSDETGLYLAQIGTSDFFEIEASHINPSGLNENPIFVDIPLIPVVDPGKETKDDVLMIGGLDDNGQIKKYLIGVHYFGNVDGTRDFEIGRTQTSNQIFIPEKAMYQYRSIDNLWYYSSESSSIPMIRMVFQDGTAINEFNAKSSNLNVYPNPVKDVLNFEFNASNASTHTLRIMGVNGQVILEEKYNDVSGDVLKSIDVSSLKSGIYFIQIMNEKEISSQKFIRQ